MNFALQSLFWLMSIQINPTSPQRSKHKHRGHHTTCKACKCLVYWTTTPDPLPSKGSCFFLKNTPLIETALVTFYDVPRLGFDKSFKCGFPTKGCWSLILERLASSVMCVEPQSHHYSLLIMLNHRQRKLLGKSNQILKSRCTNWLWCENRGSLLLLP